MRATEQHLLQLKFKGNRNYVQGGDIYNAVNNLAPLLFPETDAYLGKIAFRAFARHDCYLMLAHPRDSQTLIATGTIVNKKGFSNDIWISETERPVSGRYDFVEEDIIAPAKIMDKSIILKTLTSYTAIEETIALAKALHYSIYPIISGKWVFAQLDLIQPFFKERQSLRITVNACISNRFSVSDIYQDSNNIGHIRFMVGEP